MLQVDRKETYYRNDGYTFPHHEFPEYTHVNTVLDGELVIDIDPNSKLVRSYARLPERSADQ